MRVSGSSSPSIALHPLPSPSLAEAERVVEAVWGYRGLRAAQRRAIAALLHGRDCLAVLPTGGGKSLCFQVPGLMLPGLTVGGSPPVSRPPRRVASGGGRGPLHRGVGPRLPAALSPPRPPPGRLGRRPNHRAHGDGHARDPSRHLQRARPVPAGVGAHVLRPPQSALRGPPHGQRAGALRGPEPPPPTGDPRRRASLP